MSAGSRSLMSDEKDYDQDSEPTMTAPESGRPDGIMAAKDEEGHSQAEADPDDDS
jgi:hypothetical protein